MLHLSCSVVKIICVYLFLLLVKLFSVNIGRRSNLINTNDKAELQNCINNAKSVIGEIKSAINRINDQQERQELQKLSNKADTLLDEANQRFNKIM
ncbi:hypothetical protein Desgi_3649 [Desulfoscipio gibsoniae DSM 7213]|uniref:Uncharacterized protein n=1 Tax=Desulfoscipio gibsoniae DSM 7213 TaxID=767817 RepID=R4KN21_9FIRM|nr:hypothetical protein Desgi_3649 [Desulfoscipio gibsoniae DSM 7213]